MKKLSSLLILILCTLMISQTALAISIPIQKKDYIRHDEIPSHAISQYKNLDSSEQTILVKFLNSNEIDHDLLLQFGFEQSETQIYLSKNNIYKYKTKHIFKLHERLELLKQHNQITDITMDVNEYHTAYIPNDPYYPVQWHLTKINMPDLWASLKRPSDIIVAVLDTGIDHNHPDLAGRILPGYNFYSNNTNTMDDNGHGTMVTGVIAANFDNGIGLSGMDPDCKILPVKVLDAEGNGSTSDIISGIYYAIEQGAHVINMSFSSTNFNSLELSALWDAYDEGIILVAASGNQDSNVTYPAAYIPVISVGATDQMDYVTNFSNYGRRLDICAPGVSIASTYPDNKYYYGNGTSLSSPIVAALSSILLGQNQHLSPWEVKWLIESSAFMPGTHGDEWNWFYGYGRVDAASALEAPMPDLTMDAGDTSDQAMKLSSNNSVNQYIERPMDDDWFTFDITHESEVTINITVPPTLDLVVWLLRVDEDVVVWDHLIDYGDIGEDETDSFMAVPGTYYMYIYDYNNRWSTSPYTIHIQVDDQTYYGDVNNDEMVDINDAMLVLRHIVGTSQIDPGSEQAANVDGSTDENGSPTIDIMDAMLIMRYIVGLIEDFPINN